MTSGREFDLAICATELGRFQLRRPFRIVFEPVTASTMNLAAERFQATGVVDEYAVYVAGEQTKGAGARGAWFHGPHDVAMTMVLPNEPNAERQRLIRMAVGVAVIQTLSNLGSSRLPKLVMKWPNDVFVQQSQQKLCGILTVGADDRELHGEMRGRGYTLLDSHLQIGVGINLGREVSRQSGLRGKPTSVENLTGERLSREAVVARFVGYFDELLTELESELTLQRFLATASHLIWRAADGTCIVEHVDGRVEKLMHLGLAPTGFLVRHGAGSAVLPYTAVRRFCAAEAMEL